MKIKSKLFFTFAAIVALTTILGIISHDNASRVGTEFTFLVEHDLNVLQNAQKLQKLVVDAETGQRGFIITGDESFLEPYTLGISQFDELLQIEMELVSNNPAQMEKLKMIEELFLEWQTKVAIHEIELARSVHESDISALSLQYVLAEGTGKSILDELRSHLEILLEHTLLENHIEQQLLLRQISKDLVDKETGQRGFLITGKEEFLEPYTLGNKNFNKHVSQLIKLLQAEEEPDKVEEEIASINKIIDLAHQWDVEAGIPEIEARKVIDENPTIFDVSALLKVGTGKNILDQIRFEFTEFIEIENDLKDQRFLYASKIESETKIFTVGIIIITASFASILGFLLYRTILPPLTNLRNAAEIITQGDYNVELKHSGSDELSDLTLSFSKMTKYLKSSQNDLNDKIIDLKLINEQLIESESKFKNLYHSSPDMFRTINIDGTILDCNDVYAEKLGYSRAEVIGESIFKHVTTDSSDAMQKSFRAWRNDKLPINHEVQMRRKDGTSFQAFVKASNLYDQSGNLIGSNTAIRDVSEIYKIKRQYEEEKIKRLSVMGELTSRVSHDLLNPLTAIKNSLFLLQSKLEIPDKNTIQEYERLNRSVSRMTHQIEDVLDFVKTKPLTLKNSSISEILNNVIERIRIPENILINLPTNDKQIVCDQEKLEIVFINLITNAMQAMNQDGKIDIKISDKDNYTIIEIEDSGPGISDDSLPKIFDPLFTTREIGTGLGLVSCKNIVERHRGTIEVETVVGKGTTFTIKLPKMVKEIVQK